MSTPATPAALDGLVDQPSRPTAAAAPESGHTAFRRFLLIALTAIGPISFQIFLPSLPAIQAHFGVSAGTAQLALSLSMLGIAVATLAYGSLSDRFGRRPVMLAGMAVLLAGSLVCAFASSIEMLIVGRIVQAAGGAAGMVVTRAIVLDLYGREGASRVMAELMAAMMVAPMLATPLGGLVNDVLGWRANFLTIALAAAGTLALVVFGLGETRRTAADARPVGLLQAYKRLLASATFDGFACQGAFAMAAFLTFMTAAPTYLTGNLGISATAVGFNFVAVSVGFMAGSLLASRVPKASRPERPVLFGSAIAFAAAVAALGLALAGSWTMWALIGPATVLGFANGISTPSAQAGAIAAVPDLSGTASGLSGFLGTLVGAAATQIVGMLQNGTPYPIVLTMTLASGLALAAAIFAWRRAGDRTSSTGQNRRVTL